MAFWNKNNTSDELFDTANTTINTTTINTTTIKLENPINTNVSQLFQTNENTLYCPIPKGMRIKGEIYFDMPVLIEGEVTGEIISSSKLVIGQNAKIVGTVRVKELVVQGVLKAETIVSKKAYLASTANVDNSIQAKILVVEEGAQLKAKIISNLSMIEKSEALKGKTNVSVAA